MKQSFEAQCHQAFVGHTSRKENFVSVIVDRKRLGYFVFVHCSSAKNWEPTLNKRAISFPSQISWNAVSYNARVPWDLVFVNWRDSKNRETPKCWQAFHSKQNIKEIVHIPPLVSASMKPRTMAVLRAVPNSSNEYLQCPIKVQAAVQAADKIEDKCFWHIEKKERESKSLQNTLSKNFWSSHAKVPGCLADVFSSSNLELM